jgi:hypothetical protein
METNEKNSFKKAWETPEIFVDFITKDTELGSNSGGDGASLS